ncbi:hypothetical protein Ancab_013727 [Ancistrocladus abbreviatus]
MTSTLDMSSRRRRRLRSCFGIRQRPVPIRVHGDPRIGGGGRFTCSFCGVEFRNNFALSGHLNVHRPRRRRSVSPEVMRILLPERSRPIVTPTSAPPPPPPPPADVPPGAVRIDEDLWLLPGPPMNTVGPGSRSVNNGSNSLPPPVPAMCNRARQLLAMAWRASVRNEMQATETRLTATANGPPSPPTVLARAVRRAALARALKLTPEVRAPALRPMTTNNGPLPPPPDSAHPMPTAAPRPRPRIIPEVEATRSPVNANNGPLPDFPCAKSRAPGANRPVAAQIVPTTLPFAFEGRMLVPGWTHGPLLAGPVAANNSLSTPLPGLGQIAVQAHGPAITQGMQGTRSVVANNGASLLPPRCEPSIAANNRPSRAAIPCSQAVAIAMPASGPVLSLEAQARRPSAHGSGHGLLIQQQIICGSSCPRRNPQVDWLRLASGGGGEGVKDDEDLSGTTITDPDIRALLGQAGQEAEKLNLNLELALSGCQK